MSPAVAAILVVSRGEVVLPLRHRHGHEHGLAAWNAHVQQVVAAEGGGGLREGVPRQAVREVVLAISLGAEDELLRVRRANARLKRNRDLGLVNSGQLVRQHSHGFWER